MSFELKCIFDIFCNMKYKFELGGIIKWVYGFVDVKNEYIYVFGVLMFYNLDV